jgi:gamma-glutamylcyclotransferase (GGCT)/AIG2-like uncharacterized protein YtfP
VVRPVADFISIRRMSAVQYLLTNKLHRNPMIDLWIYVFNQPVDGMDKIEEPSWHEYKRKREKPECRVT